MEFSLTKYGCLFFTVMYILYLVELSYEEGFTVQEVSVCPMNETVWSERAEKLNCSNGTEYHCAIAENRKYRIEICLEKSSIASGNCPKILSSGYLDWWRCNETNLQCPKDDFLTTEVYKYPLCYGVLKTKERHKKPTRHGGNNEERRNNAGMIVGIFIVAIIIIIGISLGVVYLYVRKKESGIVKTKYFYDGLRLIEKEHSLVLIGKLGNSVSTTGKSITSAFIKSNPGWTSSHFNYKDITSAYALPANSIVFVDGWFGLWNDDPGELENVKTALGILKSKAGEEQKLVVGMRTDICDRYKHELEKGWPDLFKARYIDLDATYPEYENELEQHFKNKLKKCNKSGCWCRKLSVQDIKDTDLEIGNFLQIDILSKMHSVISEFSRLSDIKEILISHFRDLKNTDKELYQCIMYVVFKGMYDEGVGIDEHLTNKTNMNISKVTFNNKKQLLLQYYMKSVPKDRLVNKTQCGDRTTGSKTMVIVFWHVFMYICAFHSIYREHSELLLTHCNVDAINQLVRSNKDDSTFTVENRSASNFNTM